MEEILFIIALILFVIVKKMNKLIFLVLLTWQKLKIILLKPTKLISYQDNNCIYTNHYKYNHTEFKNQGGHVAGYTCK